MSHAVTPPTRFIGLDVGKSEIFVFDQSTGAERALQNEPRALAEFAAALDETCFCVCEATGGYEAALLDALCQAGRAAHRADARKVKAFIRSFGRLGKTDALDARALARYGQERCADLPLWTPPHEARDTLHGLVLLRRDLVTDRVAWNNRRQAPTAKHAVTNIDHVIKTLEDEIKAVEDKISNLINDNEDIKRDEKTLREIPGIGPTTAAGLIALMPELGTIDRREIASLAGLAPHPCQSSTREGYRLTRGGRPEVKRLLFMAAMVAGNGTSDLATFYKRLIANGKKRIVALTALMRKIIVIANAKIRDARIQVS